MKKFLSLVITGGFLGSYVGVVGLGGGINGMIPGAIFGAVLAIALFR